MTNSRCLLLLLWCFELLMMSSHAGEIEPPKIAIIGAGMTGLSAGRRLMELGLRDFDIFEGADRVGGRIHSIPYHGGYLQMGAQFINGEANPLYKIAAEFGLIEGELSDLAHFTESLYPTGKCSMDRSDFQLFMDFIEPLDTKYRTLAEMNQTIARSHSMKMLYDEDFARFVQKNEIFGQRLNFFEALSRPYRSYWEFEWSSDWGDQSLSNLRDWDDRGAIGVSYTTTKIGYKGIIDFMAAQSPERNIHLKHRIKNIQYDGEKIELSLDNGTRLATQYDYVIVTTSLGHLKRFSSTLFTPPLGRFKQKLIDAIGFGGSCKIFLRWENPWWLPGTHSIAPLPIKGCPGRERNIDIFEEEMTTLQTVSWEENTLMAWIAGRGHRYMDSLSDEEIIERTTRLIRYVYNNETIEKPSEIVRTKMTENELLLGAYSYVSQKQAAAGLKHGDLGMPVKFAGNLKVLFAGEATHYRMFETAVGAYQSGRREVDRLIDDWNLRHGITHRVDPASSRKVKNQSVVDKKHRISSVCANRSDGHCHPQ
ncbi:unnamed protein product, partial [Mesorhabditis belari]|uniref:Amine oxidase domain-containing protein n=1 Tax=Mesorhabditis belari TaxID=2138241 RepID=A0AAF3ELB0_9BILA